MWLAVFVFWHNFSYLSLSNILTWINLIHKKDSNLSFNHEFNPIFQAQLVGLIPPSYSEVSIGDTQEHPLGVYLEKESLYFNIT